MTGDRAGGLASQLISNSSLPTQPMRCLSLHRVLGPLLFTNSGVDSFTSYQWKCCERGPLDLKQRQHILLSYFKTPKGGYERDWNPGPPLTSLALVAHWLDSAIHRIKICSVDDTIGFPNTYPLDSDFSDGQRYPTFEQPGPGRGVQRYTADWASSRQFNNVLD